MIHLWKTYDKKLEETLLFNKEVAADITRIKVQHFIASMKPIKMFTIIVGILWVAFVDTLIINFFHVASLFFLVSAGIQVLLTQVAIVIYLYQLILVHQLDIDEPVLAAQEKLSQLKASTYIVCEPRSMTGVPVMPTSGLIAWKGRAGLGVGTEVPRFTCQSKPPFASALLSASKA